MLKLGELFPESLKKQVSKSVLSPEDNKKKKGKKTRKRKRKKTKDGFSKDFDKKI